MEGGLRMKQLKLTADLTTNFVMHMLHLVRYPDSDYSRRYAPVHKAENLRLLRESPDLMQLCGHEHDAAVREMIDLLLLCPLRGGDDPLWLTMMQTAGGILSAELEEDSFFYGRGEQYRTLIQRGFALANAMQEECGAYEQKVWLYEQLPVQLLAEQVTERIRHEGMIYRALTLLGLEMGETDDVVVKLSSVPYGAYAGFRLDDAMFVELRSDAEELYSAVVMDLIAGLMGNMLVAEDGHEPEAMDGYVATGMMMFYHKRLTGNRRYFKHYDDVIDLCEKLTEGRRPDAAALYVQLKAAHG